MRRNAPKELQHDMVGVLLKSQLIGSIPEMGSEMTPDPMIKSRESQESHLISKVSKRDYQFSPIKGDISSGKKGSNSQAEQLPLFINISNLKN